MGSLFIAGVLTSTDPVSHMANVKVIGGMHSGGADGIRTRDFLLAKQALSH